MTIAEENAPPPPTQDTGQDDAPNIRQQEHQIFISYSRADRLAVDRIYGDLEALHYRLWMDVSEAGIEAGEDWRAELERQMTRSEAVIACVSPDFLRSRHCQAEIRQALAERKPIYPVLVRRLGPQDDLGDSGIAHIQFIDMTLGQESYGTGLQRLLRVLPLPRIPTETRITRYVRALAAILAVLAVFIGGMIATVVVLNNFVPPPTVDGHNIGVVMAPFTIPDDGSVGRAEANEVVQRFSNLLEKELDASFEPLRLTYGYLGPDQTQMIESDLDDYADIYGTDVVIHGEVVRSEDGELLVDPRFYIDPDAFLDALEMTGTSRFGSTIVVGSLENPFEQVLSSRTNALVQVVIGLSSYIVDDFEGALQAFEAAASTPDLQGAAGSEVLQVLLGSTRLQLATISAQRREFDSAYEYLDAAEIAYEAVTAIREDYARAYTGLAGSAYIRWNLNQQTDGEADLDLLQQADAYLERSIAAGDQPNEIYQTRALLPQMQIDFAMWFYYPNTAFETGAYGQLYLSLTETIDEVLARYETGGEAVADIALEAYKFRGLSNARLNNHDSALDAYKEALDISASPGEQALIYGWMGSSYDQLGQADEADTAYESALELARTVDGFSPDLIAEYESNLETGGGRS